MQASATACSCRRTDSARTATATSGRATAVRSQDNPATKGRGFQLFKFSPDGKVLLSLGKAGVSKAGPDTFIGPTACAIAPNGDIIVADGHWPRPTDAQQDGDRLVRLKTDGTFVAEYGKMGTAPGEFMGPHALAFDSQGRLFVADRSNNRVQVFDRNMQFVDEWRHFGRPSGIAILKDDTLIVADSESSQIHRWSATSARGRRQHGAQSRMGQRHQDRQREGRFAPLLRPGHASGRYGRGQRGQRLRRT